MISIKEILKNRFNMTKDGCGITDNYSDGELCLGSGILEITHLNIRGLDSYRGTVAQRVLRPQILIGGRKYPINIESSESYPWVFRAYANTIAGKKFFRIEANLVSPEKNNFKLFLDIDTDVPDYSVSFGGAMAGGEKERRLMCGNNSVTGVYCIEKSADPNPGYAIYSDSFVSAETDSRGRYTLTTDKLGGNVRLEIDISVFFTRDLSKPYEIKRNHKTLREILTEREAWWSAMLKPIANPDCDIDVVRCVRCAAGLIRCGCEWNIGDEKIIASYCSISGWSGLVCFWDSMVGAVGLSHFSPELAIDAVRAAYARQREDGFVTSTTYKFAPHNEIYPQAPITGWALKKILENTGNNEKVTEALKELLPKAKKLHMWYLNTQDHDGDGLPEWRFTGAPADNSPIYDYYAKPINRSLDGEWNIYLPPIASVSLASFLIQEEKCFGELFRLIGEAEEAEFFINKAAELEELLNRYCFNGEMYHDYDHIFGRYNDVLTLYSFLPIWAGVRMDEDIKHGMIKKYLLDEKYFFGEYPLPYVAYSEKEYSPTGYWRGRIWPHTTLWMLELLRENGYNDEAAEIEKRLINMMNQSEEIRENYFSDPGMEGGGVEDFLWSFAAYLELSHA